MFKPKDETTSLNNMSTIGKTSTFSPELKRSLKTSRPESPDVTRAAKRLERSRQKSSTLPKQQNGFITRDDDLKSEYIEIVVNGDKLVAGGNDAKVFVCDVHKRKQSPIYASRAAIKSDIPSSSSEVIVNEDPRPLLPSTPAASSGGEQGVGQAKEESEMLGAISKTSKRLVLFMLQCNMYNNIDFFQV